MKNILENIWKKWIWNIWKLWISNRICVNKKTKKAENWRLIIVELTEKMYNKYWSIEEMDNVRRIEAFISILEIFINLIIL